MTQNENTTTIFKKGTEMAPQRTNHYQKLEQQQQHHNALCYINKDRDHTATTIEYDNNAKEAKIINMHILCQYGGDVTKKLSSSKITMTTTTMQCIMSY